MNQHPRALVTGAARRIGACISQHLHAAGYDIILHYRESVAEAEQLCAELNTRRANSCTCLQADLEQMEAVEQMAATVTASFRRPSSVGSRWVECSSTTVISTKG